MANGKKNYFRHSFFAGNDDKIVSLISNHGKEAYFHYFRILELCGQQSAESVPEKFVIHARTLCAELMVTRSRLGGHLLAMKSSLLLDYVLTSDKVELHIPNFSKYLGKYENKKSSNTPNKIKEKEIKLNESKEKTITPDEVLDLWNLKHGEKFGYCPGIGSGKHRENILEAIKFLKTAQDWENLFNKATNSEFLTGNNKSDWTVNFLWLIDYDNALKVLSDNFDDQKIVRAIQSEFLQKVQK